MGKKFSTFGTVITLLIAVIVTSCAVIVTSCSGTHPKKRIKRQKG